MSIQVIRRAAVLLVAALLLVGCGTQGESASDRGADSSEGGGPESAGGSGGSSGGGDGSSGGISGPIAIDVCQWVDYEMNRTDRYAVDGPADNMELLPLIRSSGYQEVRADPDLSAFTIDCVLEVETVRVYVGHEGGSAVTVSLIVDPGLAFSPTHTAGTVPDAEHPYRFPYRGHDAAVDLEGGVLTVELAEATYLRLALGGVLDSRMNEANEALLARLAADMLDAWDEDRVPTFENDTTSQANVMGICAPLHTLMLDSEILPSAVPVVLRASGDRSQSDGEVTARVECEVEPADPADDAEKEEILSADLSWAPSESDADLAGGENAAGCIESAGLLVSCDSQWLIYATVTGRWLVQTAYRDRADLGLPTGAAIADTGVQGDVVALGDDLTEAMSTWSLGEVLRPEDPRMPFVEGEDANPWDLDCVQGSAIQGVRTARVTALVCETDGRETFLTATIDGEPFHGDIWLWPSEACASDDEHLIEGRPAILCADVGNVVVSLSELSHPVIREFADEAWALNGTFGPDE